MSRLFSTLIAPAVGLLLAVALFSSVPAAQAAGIVISASTVTTSVTSIEISVTTNISSYAYWCVTPNYPLQKFYGVSLPATSTCLAPYANPDFSGNLPNGWIREGGAVTDHSFSVPHLQPNTAYNVALVFADSTNLSNNVPASANRTTRQPLAFSTPPSIGAITFNSATATWATNRDADTRIEYTATPPTWQQERTGAEVIEAVAVSGNNLAVAVGRGGIVYRKTGDDGSWTQNTLPTGDLFGVAVVDNYTAWAVGNSGAIFYSDNGGVTWTMLSTGQAIFWRGVAAPTPTRAVVVGESGKIYRTDDAGTSWSLTTLPTGQFEDVAAGDANMFWAVGESGIVARSTDGGVNWTHQFLPGAGTLLSVSAKNASEAALVNGGGDVYRTTDGGASWQRVFVSGLGLQAVTYAQNGLWALGSGTTVARSVDGVVWTTSSESVLSGAGVLDAAGISPTSVLAVGTAGRIYGYGPGYLSWTVNGLYSQAHPDPAFPNATTMSPLSCVSRHYYSRVASVDDAIPASVLVSTDLEFDTLICPDMDPPTVTITDPAANTVVGAASYTIRGTASDPAGGTGVQSVNVSRDNGATWNPATMLTPQWATWSYGATLVPGTNTIRAEAFDGTPNRDEDGPRTIFYDNRDPVVTINAPYDVNQILSTPVITVSGDATDNTATDSGLANVRVTITQAATTTVLYDQALPAYPASHPWSVTPTLQPGANTLTVTAVDRAGRSGATGTRTVVLTFDNGDPSVSFNATDGQCGKTSPFVFSGDVVDASGVNSIALELNGVPVPAANVTISVVNATTKHFSSALPLVDGTNHVFVIAQDNAGNSVTQPAAPGFVLKYDSTAPVATIVPALPALVSNPTLHVQGTGSDGGFSCGLGTVELRVGQPAPASPGVYGATSGTPANWSKDVTLTSGDNLVQARISDLAGWLVETAPVTVTLDNNNPRVFITPPADTNVSTTPFTLSGTADDNVSLQSLVLSPDTALPAVPVGTVTPALPTLPSAVTWSHDVPLHNGVNHVTVTVTDNVGLTGVARIDVTYTAPDSTPPVISEAGATSAPDCVNGQIYIIFSWKTDEPADSFAEWGPTNAYGTSLTRDAVPPGTLVHNVRAQPVNARQIYYYRIRSADALGNSSDFTGQITSDDVCDTTQPTVTIDDPPPGNVSGTVNVRVTATDNRAISEIAYTIDGTVRGTSLSCVSELVPTTCTRGFQWDTTQETNGPYAIEATAKDPSGNIGSGGPVNVTVDNDVTPPIVSGVILVTKGENPDGTWYAVIAWTTNEDATSRIDYGLENLADGSYAYTAHLEDSTPVQSHSLRLDGLLTNQRYHYQVSSCDSVGNCGH